MASTWSTAWIRSEKVVVTFSLYLQIRVLQPVSSRGTDVKRLMQLADDDRHPQGSATGTITRYMSPPGQGLSGTRHRMPPRGAPASAATWRNVLPNAMVWAT